MSLRSRRPRPGLPRLTAAGFVVAIVAASVGIAAPASANPAPAYSAASSATLVHVDVLSGTALGALNGASLADVKVSHAASGVNSAGSPQSRSEAAILKAALAGNTVLELPKNSIAQTAAPDNPAATELDVLALDLGLLKVGVGELKSSARWNDGTAKPTGPVQLTNSAAGIASVVAIPGVGLPVAVPAVGASVLETKVGYSHSKTGIVEVNGQDGLGVRALARTSLLDLTLFKGTAQEIRIEVISPPTLTATATGTDKSSVTYSSPLVKITAAGQSKTLDTPDKVFEIPLAGLAPGLPALPNVTKAAPALPAVPGAPDVQGLLCGLLPCDAAGGAGIAPAAPAKKGAALLRLSLGHLDKTVTPTSVSGEAATLRLEVLDIPGTGKLLDVAIGELKASATAPAGGIVPDGSPSPSASNGGGNGDGELPVTGTSLTLLLAGGVGMLVLGRFAMVWARRFQ